MIPFNKPFISNNELKYIEQAVASGKISGDGIFTKKCHDFFCSKYGFKKTLLTTSCTHALEMAAILINVQPGDEIIMPSYTFVSTANAFVLRGAKIIFADSSADHPNMDANQLEKIITHKTKAIVVVHYAGMACDMDKIMAIANKHQLFVIEDAAQAIDTSYKGKPLGGIGHLAAFSFHETKNIIAGEGGMLVINDERFFERAEIIREKGTNRSKFFRGEIDKYGWVDIGSSYLPSEIISAFLYGQLENLETIQEKRKQLWDQYYHNLSALGNLVQLPIVPAHSTNNAHIFYIVLKNIEERDALITYLRKKEIYPVFHYLSLHKSAYFLAENEEKNLPHSDHFTDSLLRLPLYYELTLLEVDLICNQIKSFFENNN